MLWEHKRSYILSVCFSFACSGLWSLFSFIFFQEAPVFWLFSSSHLLWAMGLWLYSFRWYNHFPFLLTVKFKEFSSLLKFKCASIFSSLMRVTVVFFSLFWLQLAQALSRIFLFQEENGEVLDWEGFQYFTQLTVCRKLSSLSVVSMLKKSYVLICYRYNGPVQILFEHLIITSYFVGQYFLFCGSI